MERWSLGRWFGKEEMVRMLRCNKMTKIKTFSKLNFFKFRIFKSLEINFLIKNSIAIKVKNYFINMLIFCSDFKKYQRFTF